MFWRATTVASANAKFPPPSTATLTGKGGGLSLAIRSAENDFRDVFVVVSVMPDILKFVFLVIMSLGDFMYWLIIPLHVDRLQLLEVVVKAFAKESIANTSRDSIRIENILLETILLVCASFFLFDEILCGLPFAATYSKFAQIWKWEDLPDWICYRECKRSFLCLSNLDRFYRFPQILEELCCVVRKGCIRPFFPPLQIASSAYLPHPSHYSSGPVVYQALDRWVFVFAICLSSLWTNGICNIRHHKILSDTDEKEEERRKKVIFITVDTIGLI